MSAKLASFLSASVFWFAGAIGAGKLVDARSQGLNFLVVDALRAASAPRLERVDGSLQKLPAQRVKARSADTEFGASLADRDGADQRTQDDLRSPAENRRAFEAVEQAYTLNGTPTAHDES
jgi:hypothetical protein